jgi:hypothetical protein
MTIKILPAATALALLAACGGGSEEANDSGVTREEAVALDNAAGMLDASPDSLVAAEDTPLGNGETPVEDVANTGDLPVTDEPAANTQ